MKYKVPVMWSVTGEYEIEADSEEDAIHKSGFLPLPENECYVDGSFEVFEDEVEEIKESDKT